jgi:hypothetical protein
MPGSHLSRPAPGPLPAECSLVRQRISRLAWRA